MKSIPVKSLMPAFFAIVALAGNAKVELPDIISSNAVLQQNSNAKLWGWAKPGSTVDINPSWSSESFKAKADKGNGKWEIKLPTPEASFTPYCITFNDGDGEVKIDNILMGEVWFCSGQSNMEMPLRGYGVQPIEGAGEAIAYASKYPGIRMANIPKKASYTPQDKVEGKWKTSNPADAAEFSALAYFFARSLSDILNVPIGIINCAYGGSKVEGWIPKWKLDTYPEWDMASEENKEMGEWERIGVMYNAMLKPVIGYTVKGFLWNQGESNVGRHHEYPQHQKDMVEIWRDEWQLGQLPFYFVELPGWEYSNPDGDDAAKFRECQHKAAEILPNSGIVCTSDLVYPFELKDIHARKKKEIGERLAFMAGARTYGLNGLPHQFPSFKSVDLQGDKAVLTFNNAVGGLNPNIDLPGFEVAGEDKVFYPAQASEDWNWPFTVTVSSDKVKDIKSVRYCFKNFAIGQLKDMYGLPLIPFRTDDW